MDMLGETVASTCPAAFSGASGAVFINTVTALIAAHCSILNDNEWPKDNSMDVLNGINGLSYDFIVVGAGTAGSIVASGLSERFPSCTVLLIEAGEDPGLDSEIPAFIFLNQNVAIDWNYKTEPDAKSCLGFINNSCIWSKGRAMGGSSSINAMLYIRGHPDDYDNWNDDEITGWSYKDLEAYFRKVEDKLHYEEIQTQNNPWDTIIRTAWDQLGYDSSDTDIEARIGAKKIKLLTRDGKRLNSAKIYLKGSRSNLHVMKNTIVNKISIDTKSKIVNGVEIRHASGISANIRARKEVILCAGSVATPQILMHSGIGPMTHLEAIGIKCLIDLPVGQNLQDHLILPIFLKTELHTNVSAQELLTFLLQYMLTRTGPFSNIGITDFMGFIKTDHSSNYPNIQFHNSYFTKNDKFMLAPYLKGVGYREEIIETIVSLNKESDLLGIYPTLIHPKSRGEILLSNINKSPIIKSNYFQDPEDLETLMKAIDFIEKLVKTDSFKDLGVRVATLNIPGCSKYFAASAQYWECYIRHMATTIYHPVGTAKMSVRLDEGVVCENLLVHGFRNLRIVDASIMPSIPSSNTMAPTMVIAEKAVDLIVKHFKERVEL